MPKVSVIIPTYNRGYIVRKTIDNALSQTVQDIELLVVDDGSTDNTREIVEMVDDRRVRYFYKENGGVSSARNFGLSKSKAEFMAFLDSDDVWPKNYLEVMLASLRLNEKYGVAYASVGFICKDGKKDVRIKEKYRPSGWITQSLFRRGFVSVQATVFRKRIFDEALFDEYLKSAEDSDAFLRLSVKTQFFYVPKVCVYLRDSTDSLSKSVGINCNRILSLERFYFQLGGKELILPHIARLKLSHAYRQTAKKYRLAKNRKAAIFLYGRAIKYYPLDLRLYLDMLKSLMLERGNDRLPEWKMQEPLGHPLGTNRFG